MWDDEGNYLGVESGDLDNSDGAINDPWAGYTNNGDGTVTDPGGDIYDTATGNQVGFQNSDGTWTDLQGNVFNADNTPYLSLNDLSGGNLNFPGGDHTAIGYTDNGNGTVTEQFTGDTVYPNGDREHDDGTWTFSDGTNYDPLENGSKPSTDQLLARAGAPAIGGAQGGSTGGMSSGSNSNQNNSAIQTAIAALAALARQALASNNPSQLSAVRAAQARLGVAPAAPSSNWLPLAAAAAIAVFIFSAR